MEKTRFSLLLLEPGEIYFEDFSAQLFYPNITKDVAAESQYGRLKMCSKSLVFDPQDIRLPILKMQLKESKIDNEQSWFKPNQEFNVINVDCMWYTEILAGNVIAPYTFKHVKTKFLFLLNYGKVEDILPQILQLQRASTLPPPEQNSMIAAIVHSRQSRVSFDPKLLEDLYEEIILETQGNKISPLVVNPGRIVLTSSRLYFQPYNNVEVFPVLKISLEKISRIICRRFLLKHVGVEIFCDTAGDMCSSGVKHLYLVLKAQKDRDNLYEAIMKQSNVSLKTCEQEVMTLKWQNHAVSTYDYLMYLNSLADRSFNDLTQYPVFPWVIANYTSSELNLNDPETFRDLNKPIGAINKERLQRLHERCQEMSGSKFLYGSHYSAPGFVLFYLIRKFPHYMLCLQNGRFDQPDRMFNSVSDVWRNVMNSMSDFKELIPEFYDDSQSGDFLLNNYGINFGYRHDNSKVGNVELPPWAENASDFVSKLRLALESSFVSANIHQWIDLIFGYKQRGKQAEEADNLFYHLCYEGAVDLDSVQDLSDKHALEVQIMEFGQIPKQLFKIPHPQRLPLSCSSMADNCRDSKSENSASVDPDLRLPLNRQARSEHVLGQHKAIVTAVAVSDNSRWVISVSKDCLLKLYNVQTKSQTRSIRLSTVGIACCILLPDNQTVVLGTYDDNILVYDLEFGKIIDTILAHEDSVSSLCWCDRHSYLVSGSSDGSVKVWKDIMQAGKWHRLKFQACLRFDRDSGVSTVAVDRENRLIGCGTEDGHVTVWNLSDRTMVLDLPGHEGLVSAISFTKDGFKLVSCGLDRVFKVYDLLTSMEVYYKTYEEDLMCLAWDATTLILGSKCGHLFFWDLIQVEMIDTVYCNHGPVVCMHVSHDGTIIVTGENKAVVLRM